MHIFKDRNGRDWPIVIDVAAVRRVRRLLAVDLYRLFDDGLVGLSKLLDDPIGLVDVLFVLCMDAAEHAKVSDEDFGRIFSGDTIESASDAFVAELIDFFPDAARREAIRTALAKAKEASRLMAGRLAAELGRIDPEALVAAWNPSSPGSPESSGSTPDPSPSGNST